MILAIIQARMSSSRLPNKVLKIIVGKPMLQLQIERIKQAKLIDKIIVATSRQNEDDAIAQLCQQLNIDCFRGNLNDVLDRFYQAAITDQAAHIVRLTADCPLIDASVIDSVIDLHVMDKNDYTSNSLKPTFPDGLDVEVMNQAALNSSWQQAVIPSEREHVTLYIRNHPEKYKIGELKSSIDLSNKRWTVDHQDDLYLISKIYSTLYYANPNFSTQDILTLLEQNPEWEHINSNIIRNEGLAKSILEDLMVDKKIR
jgi:spore coat polysaccharide biosynthesis protein SpsF